MKQFSPDLFGAAPTAKDLDQPFTEDPVESGNLADLLLDIREILQQ